MYYYMCLSLEPVITDNEGHAMARAAVNLFARWNLDDRQACILLGDLQPSTYARWQQSDVGTLSRDLKARLAHLMAIHGALRTIFRDPERGYAWVRKPNAAFEGHSALDVMVQGELCDLMRVRAYLDAVSGR